MNKKGDVEIDKIIILVLAILALIVVFIIVKDSLLNLIDLFFSFIKEMFK